VNPILNELVLLLCLALLFVTKAALISAVRRGDGRLARVLHILRLGLALSSVAYLLRLLMPASDIVRLVSLLCTFAGAVLIWIGGLEHASLRRERLSGTPVTNSQETDDEADEPTEAGLPRLNSHARRVLRHAADEARRRRQSCVDTDHVLLGLLRERQSEGTDILGRLNIRPESIRLALGDVSGPDRPPETLLTEAPLPLTDRARQTLSLAAQEAHRFDKVTVGTDHLLLGLVLMGTGAAASTLFQAGATVDGIRGEIMRGRLT
jgi:hypothetical protein